MENIHSEGEAAWLDALNEKTPSATPPTVHPSGAWDRSDYVFEYGKRVAELGEARKELRHLADLLDAHFERGGTVAGIGTTNKARQILSLENT